MKQKKEKCQDKYYDNILKKLNIIIRLLLELNIILAEERYTVKSAVKKLYSYGLTPKEIALILGYKSPTVIAPYLYSNKKLRKNGDEKGQIKSQDIR